MSSLLTIAILAAGSSKRLGQSKQRLLINGKTLLEQILSVALDAAPEEVLVIASDQDNFKDLNLIGCRIIENLAASQGIGSSIRCAHNSVNKAHSLLLCLVDQPNLSTTHLNKLIAASVKEADLVIATQYPDGAAGIPALFPPKTRQLLATLKDEEGAKRHIAQTSHLKIIADYDLYDVDTPKDLEQLKQGN